MGNIEERPIRFRVRGPFGASASSTGYLAGILLITGGTVLFIDNLQILPFDLSGAFWWFALLIYCSIGFYRNKSAPIRVWSAAGMLAGVLLILGNFHIIRATSDILWPLALIAAGISMLIYRFQWIDFKRRIMVGSSSRGSSSTNALDEFAIFSGVKRRVESGNFEGGQLTSVFGSIEVDLRWAAITNADRVVVLEANTAFGAVEIRIPENWKLNMQGQAIFGAYEDKTIPSRPEPGVQTPVLIIRGNSVFGGVTVRN